jgi:DNA-binding transcriptional LysR family regulator
LIDIRLLRYFSAVAEDGSFTTAARRLHISQPALSQQIKMLERGLGVALFIRSRTPVRLTPAGEQLLGHAYRVLRAADDAEEAVRSYSAARTGRLRVGVVSGGLYDILHPVLSSLREDVPDARFPVVQLGSPDQLTAVRRGDVDVALYRRTHDEPFADLVVKPLRDDLLIAALRAGHPAGGEDGLVRLADLADERFVSFRRQRMPLVYDRCTAACHAAGFTPDIQEHIDDPLALALAVIAGAVALSGAGMAVRFPGVFYALAEPITSIAEIAAVWHPDNDNPLLPGFVARLLAHRGRTGRDGNVEGSSRPQP